jgi:hypothetical protein
VAKTTITIVRCDRCKAESGDDVEAPESVVFGYDGFTYSLDLCPPHLEDFHNTIQSMISWSTESAPLGSPRLRRRARQSEPAAPARRSGSDRERLKAIREWARANGHPELRDRGRIPQQIIDEYQAAHPSDPA